MPAAIGIIKDEHRSIAAVLHGLLYLVGEIRVGRMSPDFKLFTAMLHYIEAFPEKLHHPKEDEYLFRALRARRPEAASVLDALEAEHVRGRTLIEELATALRQYETSGAAGFEAFAQAVQAYAEFHWAHMRQEEDVVLPMAEAALMAEDWQAIDAAFQSHTDPIVGVPVSKEFRELFRRIVHLAPPPIGVGPAPSS
ncbi:MAG TPA: hemerythrin domain-containing protein [Candidatus Competibacteraceae bacterium]|nr:hemerythrin domain-containing protein [Candidatus Competibacteraceae bacterium]